MCVCVCVRGHVCAHVFGFVVIEILLSFVLKVGTCACVRVCVGMCVRTHLV